MKIILASASPRRAQLLKQINLRFEISPSDVEEVIDSRLAPDELVQSLALQKGESMLQYYPGAFVIAADTIVYYNDRYLGKPESEKDAADMLAEMSAASHLVYSGVYLATTDHNGNPEQTLTFSEKTKVTFAALDESEINQYIQSGSPMDKAGSYGIQDDFGAVFVKRIEGDYNNVVGFPLHSFYQNVKNHFPTLFKDLFNGS